MSARCPQGGGFVGDAGCTHPNHAHSALVERIVDGKAEAITASEADTALAEGFYVDGVDGRRIGFGKALKRHLDGDHVNPRDIAARKEALIQAVETVRHPDAVEKNHKGLQGRTAYAKSFEKHGILAVSDREGKNIEYVFNIIPKRSLRRKP